MKLEMYGGRDAGGWSGHGEYEHGIDTTLAPCPFCGSNEVTVSNTHTPSYTAQCENCGAEGPSMMTLRYHINRRSSRRDVENAHRDAFANAIAAWNSRPVRKAGGGA